MDLMVWKRKKKKKKKKLEDRVTGGREREREKIQSRSDQRNVI